MKKSMAFVIALIFSMLPVSLVFADDMGEGSGSKSPVMIKQANAALGFPMREGSDHDAHMHNEEGISHYNQGHYDVALKHFTVAAKIDPKSGESHYNMALCLDKLGLHGDATAHFKVAKQNAQGRKEIVNSGILNAHIGG